MALSKELRKLAKKHGIAVERGMTDAEVQPLVDAAEAAAKATTEQPKPVEEKPVEKPVENDSHENESESKNDSHESNEKILIKEYKKNEKHVCLFQQGKVAFIELNGTVIARFDSVDAGLHHLENLSRF